MPLFDPIETYSVFVAQDDLGNQRVIDLKLQSGHTAHITFAPDLPADWLQFINGNTNLWMTADKFDQVYHLIQTETPVFFTALAFSGLRVGAVHSELDLSSGEEPGELGGTEDPQTLAKMIKAARANPDRATF
jgi:hypothetical protein